MSRFRHAAVLTILCVLLAAAYRRHTPYLAVWAWIAAGLIFLVVARPRRIVALLLFVAAALLAGTAMMRFLPWAQPRVEQMVARSMTSSGDREGAGDKGLGTDPMLSGAQRLTVARRPVLRLWSDEPLWLRTGAYNDFNGKGWETEEKRSDVEGEKAAQVVLATPLNVMPLPLAAHAPNTVQRVPWIYKFTYRSAGVHAGRSAGVSPAPDARLQQLAQHLGPPNAPFDEKIRRTVEDLRSGCRFVIDTTHWNSDDRIAEFLFDKKQGYCEYFATSAVLLLRLQGVPARYVTGFKVTARNRRGNYYLVRTTDAYAWAEALGPNGWVAVDAVPPADFDRVQDALAMSRSEELIEPLRARWSVIIARWREGGRQRTISLLPWLVAIAAALFILRRLPRKRRVIAPPVADIDPGLRACFTKLEAVWATSGYPRPPHSGALEHLRTLPDDLRLVSAQIVDVVYRAAFGGQTIEPEETARFVAALDSVDYRSKSASARPATTA